MREEKAEISLSSKEKKVMSFPQKAEEEEKEICFEASMVCSYEVMMSKCVAEGWDGMEVQLVGCGYDDCSAGIVEFVKGVSCLHY